MDASSQPREGDFAVAADGTGAMRTASTAAARRAADSALESWVPALRRGEATAFAHLVDAHGGWMLQLARRLLRHEQDAQDVVQEAFLTAFRSLGGFQGQSRLSTWLHRVLVNAALMRMRRRKRKSEPVLEGDLAAKGRTGRSAELPLVWDDPPEDVAGRRELRRQVRGAIDQLPEIHRTILLLRDIEEMSTTEVAEFLDVSKQVVKTRLHRARQALRGKIGPLLGVQST